MPESSVFSAARRHRLETVPGDPLTASLVDTPRRRQPLAEFLRENGHGNASYFYPFVAGGGPEDLYDSDVHLWFPLAQSRWLVLLPDDRPPDGLEPAELRPSAAGRSVVGCAVSGQWVSRSVRSVPLLEHPGAEPSGSVGDLVLQAYPYNAFRRAEPQGTALSASIYSFAVGVHPDDVPGSARRVVIRGADRPDRTRSGFSAPLFRSDSIPRKRIVVHETLLNAVGCRAGEWLAVDDVCRSRAGPIAGRLLRRREVLVRVGPSHDPDVGYAVSRFEQVALDVLGLTPGDPVVFQRGADPTGISRTLKARAQVARAETPLQSPVDLTDVIGKRECVQIVSLDLLQREELGAEVGDVVTVRPSLISLLSREIESLTLVMLLGVVGSIAADRPIAGLVFGSLGVLIALISTVRRFR